MDQKVLSDTVYRELRAVSDRFMRRERHGHTLQPTALVNEAYLKLRGLPETKWLTRSEYLPAAINAMNQVLKDYARMRNAGKRRHERANVTVSALPGDPEMSLDDAVALTEALDALAGEEPNGRRQADLVRFVWYEGYTYEDAAERLGISARTAKRDWRWARVRLAELLGHD